jgi:preprotein translocase subunit SecE
LGVRIPPGLQDEKETRGNVENRAAIGTSGGLGNRRYLYFAFTAAGALAAFVVSEIVTYVWEYFGNPRDFVVMLVSGTVGFGGAIVAYRHPLVNQLANEVVAELSKVTWPTRKETTAATIVVIVVSVIASIVLGVYDAFWSWLTDIIYVT